MTTSSTIARFSITLSKSVAEPVQVAWNTKDGTAKAGIDYAAASGTAVFSPGETKKDVDVLVYGRAVGTEDRNFFLEMTPPPNAILGESIGECIIYLDTAGNTAVIQVIVPTGPQGAKGDSAYQSWLNLGNTGTEQDFIDSLSPPVEEIAAEVAPILNVGSSPLTAAGTSALSNPDSMTVSGLARRVAYVGATKVATVVLGHGDNLISTSDLSGDAIDFSSFGLAVRIMRGDSILSPEWSLESDGRLLVKAATAGDVLYVCDYDMMSKHAFHKAVSGAGGADLVGFSGGDPDVFAAIAVVDVLKGSMRFDDFKGSTDDEKWARLVAYSNIAVVTSIAVEFGARTHIFNSNPGTLAKPFVFRGKGNRNTFLRFNECNGIAADLSGYGSKFIQSRIEHLALVANSSNTKTGIYFNGFQSFEPHDASLVLRNISLYGLHEIDNTAPPTLEWGNAIHLLDADEISIDDVFITGSSDNGSYPTRTTSKGIFAETVTGLRVGVTNIYLCGIGIEVTGQSEGAILDGLALVAVDQGILFRDLTNPANNHCITNTHVAAHTKGIEFRQNALSASNAVAVFMSNLFILERSGEASKPLYVGIEAYVQKSSFSNIVVQSNDATTPARIGMIVSNQDNLLTNIYGRNPGVMLDAKAIDDGKYLYCTSFRASGSLSELISGDIAVVVGSGIGASPSDANAHTTRADTHRNIDLQGRGQYENIGGRHSFGYGRHNASVYLDFRTFPGGTADYDGRIFFNGGHATETGRAFALIYAAQARFSGNVTPITTNTGTCGTSTNTWAGGFTQTAFTVTSDERSKTAPIQISDAMLDAWAEVDWVQYKYLERVDAKGPDGARWHFGVVAQRALEAFNRHTLDATDYGFLCYDEWEDSDAVIDEETGEIITPPVASGSRYGIRYEEALVLEAALQRRNYERLLMRIEALEGKA